MAFLRIRDIELCYQVEGSGPPLLKIWGTGGDLRRPATDFDRRLAEHFTVLAFDQRGMGRSGKPARDVPPNTPRHFPHGLAGFPLFLATARLGHITDSTGRG